MVLEAWGASGSQGGLFICMLRAFLPGVLLSTVLWHRMSPQDQGDLAQGLCWAEVLTLPEVTYITEWIDSLPWLWLRLYKGAIGKDWTCSPSGCNEPVGLQQLEDWATELGEEVQRVPGDPISSLQQLHYGFAFFLLMGLESRWEPHRQFGFVGGEGPATTSWLKCALMQLVSIKGVTSCCGFDELNSNSASLH